MSSILNFFSNTSNEELTVALLILAVLRIYLEVIKYDFSALPIAKIMEKVYGAEYVKNFHRFGFFLSVGYFTLFAPTFFLT